jgi:monoterpene epsilon-lactone hydrolase
MPKDFVTPESVSPEAREFAQSNFTRSVRGESECPVPDDVLGWRAFNQDAIRRASATNQLLKDRYRPTLLVTAYGGVPVVDIRPEGWLDDGKLLVYVHGGAYVSGSAESSLNCTLPLASETQRRIVAVDYSLAPEARFPLPIRQVVSVLCALNRSGHRLGDMVVYGDSAGATIAVAAALELRDSGIGRIGGVMLWSPWADITETGDTYMTLKDAEPILSYSSFLSHAAHAYADQQEFSHAYVSPVHADFAPGFPPSLIQIGTRDLFLSNAVRLYQALESAGQRVTLDVYEGMWHAFQSTPYLPEARMARRRVSTFLQNLWSDECQAGTDEYGRGH